MTLTRRGRKARLGQAPARIGGSRHPHGRRLRAGRGIRDRRLSAQSGSGLPQAAELAKRLGPLARGEVAALAVAAEPKRLPDLAFTDAAGNARTLSHWRGRTVLLNLWATWCVPCRKEMPALDELQGKLGSENFEVVAVNIDTRNLDKPKAWLKEAKVDRLAYYADPNAKVFQDLKAVGKAFGMPTTLLIDPQGCELGFLSGPAEWASEDAVRLVQAALGK